LDSEIAVSLIGASVLRE